MITRNGVTYLTVGEAAADVERSRRTVQRWMGKPDGVDVYSFRGVRMMRRDDVRRIAARKARENPSRHHRDLWDTLS